MPKRKSRVFGTPPKHANKVRVKVGQLHEVNRATYKKGTVRSWYVWGRTAEEVGAVIDKALETAFGEN